MRYRRLTSASLILFTTVPRQARDLLCKRCSLSQAQYVRSYRIYATLSTRGRPASTALMPQHQRPRSSRTLRKLLVNTVFTHPHREPRTQRDKQKKHKHEMKKMCAGRSLHSAYSITNILCVLSKRKFIYYKTTQKPPLARGFCYSYCRYERTRHYY